MPKCIEFGWTFFTFSHDTKNFFKFSSLWTVHRKWKKFEVPGRKFEDVENPTGIISINLTLNLEEFFYFLKDTQNVSTFHFCEQLYENLKGVRDGFL